MYPGMCDLIDKFSSLCNVKDPSSNTKNSDTKTEKTGLSQSNHKDYNSTEPRVLVDSKMVKNKGKPLKKCIKDTFWLSLSHCEIIL